MKYPFHIVDVFSSTPFGGNQLAVLPDAAGTSAEGLDKFRAALGTALGENSLIWSAFGSMMVNFTPQADFVYVNATYT
jgi:predicted PhzF superfamily epimerase YddE/YHI9